MGLFDVSADDVKGSVLELIFHKTELVLVVLLTKGNLLFFPVLDVLFSGQSLPVFLDRIFSQILIVMKSLSNHLQLLCPVDWPEKTRQSTDKVL